MNDEKIKYKRSLAGIAGNSSNNSDTRPLTFGAIFAVILALLFLAQQTLPIIGAVALFLCSTPVVLMHLIFKRVKYTLLLVVVATFIISGITTPLWGFIFLVLFGISSFGMAIFIEKKMPSLGIIILTGIIATLATGVMMFVNFSILKTGSLDSMIEKQKKDFIVLFDTRIDKLKETNGSPEEIIQVKRMKEMILKNFKMMFLIFPALILISSFFHSGINYIVTKLVIKRLGFDVMEPFPFFEKWQLPKYFLWIFGGAYFLTTFYGSEGIMGSLGFAGMNLLVVCVFFYLTIGVSIIHHYIKLFELSKPLKIIFYIFLGINLHFILPFLIIAGFLDQMFDFRKLKSVCNV